MNIAVWQIFWFREKFSFFQHSRNFLKWNQKWKKVLRMHFHGKICPGGKWLIELMKFWLLLLKYGYRISIAYGLDMFFLPLVWIWNIIPRGSLSWLVATRDDIPEIPTRGKKPYPSASGRWKCYISLTFKLQFCKVQQIKYENKSAIIRLCLLHGLAQKF